MQSYTEKRRGRNETEVARRIKGGIERKQTDPASNQFPRCSQVLDLSLLPLVFSLILTVASRLLHLYSIIDKTSRLKMKSFSTVRDTQRGSQSYMEKRRGRRELKVT